jgi:MFS transporter, PPP family, 3-phenylpropionic acid transporter
VSADRDLRRFSVFYFCYYAALGAYTPYIGRWVDAMGHGGYVVGGMLGLWYGSRILAPPAWSAFLKSSRAPGPWFVAACALTLLCFAGFTATRSALGLFAVMACFGLAYNAVMPQFEAMTLAALGPRSAEYGRIRVWGSVGFLLVALLMQVGFGAFYVFFTLHLQAQGHSGLAIGALWGIGVLVEIALFWQAPSLIARFGAPALLSFCLAVTVLRWTATALLAGNLPVMAVAQALHAFSFAIFHACCMRMMSEYFPGKRAAAGQSLLYGFSSGVGGVLGAGLAAWMWDLGGGRAAFLAGAAVVALAWLVYALRGRPAAAAA